MQIRHILASIAACAITFAANVHAGYLIEPGCPPEVQIAMNGAFRLAQAGLDYADHAVYDGGDRQLIQWMITRTPANFGSAGRNIIARLRDILALNRAAQTPLAARDVRIYCDESRITTYKFNPLKKYDTHRQEFVSSSPCSSLVPPLAWTSAPVPDEHGHIPNGRYDIIQLCPWYIEKVQKATYATNSRIPFARLAKLYHKLPLSMQAEKFKAQNTLIDFLYVLDQTLLHELMHTNASERLLDVEDKGILPGLLSYGWKNCRSIVERDNTPHHNADNWALYCTASYLVSEGYTVYENGDYESATGQTPGAHPNRRKRTLWESPQKAGLNVSFVGEVRF